MLGDVLCLCACLDWYMVYVRCVCMVNVLVCMVFVTCVYVVCDLCVPCVYMVL